MDDPRFFKRILGPDPASWNGWKTYLRALFGLPIPDDEMAFFRESTGRETPPADPVKESFVLSGRRPGKSRMAALIAVYLATSRDWRKILQSGETGVVFILSVDRPQSQIVKKYVSAILHSSATFKSLVERELAEEIILKNGVTISIRASSFRTVRGYSVIAAILEELAFWRSDESANPDREIINALRPAMANVPGSVLLGISTAYMAAGFMFDAFRRHWGREDGALIWKSTTEKMNPTFNRREIERAMAEDPDAARAEYFSEFRQDITAFLSTDAVNAVVTPPKVRIAAGLECPIFGLR